MKTKKEKILIIGQAPPLQKQKHPYDTTMLYDWLKEVGVSKKEAQHLFEFEAMTDKKPIIGKGGGHLAPYKSEISDYMNRVLSKKIAKAKVIIYLGNCSKNYFGYSDFFIEDCFQEKTIFTLIHPSKRNVLMYRENKELIHGILKRAIYLNKVNN